MGDWELADIRGMQMKADLTLPDSRSDDKLTTTVANIYSLELA